MEEWKPERWLCDDSEKKAMEDKFVVFSKGPRGCVGKEIAMMMLGLAVQRVLEQWYLNAEGKATGKNYLEMQYKECKIRFTEIEKQ